MRYRFKYAQNYEGQRARLLVWHSDPIDAEGTVWVMFCDEDWFWANPCGRWMLENEAQHNDEHDPPGFRGWRFTPATALIALDNTGSRKLVIEP